MNLVDRLTAEHNALRDALEKINQLRISQPEGKEHLFKIKTLLLGHLHREDTELYPALDRLAENKMLTSSFREEMQAISKAVLNFFSKYNESVNDPIAFARDFGQIRAMLIQRMIREETRLYPAYREHH